ncbi:phage major tail protein, TP901-1 family, partial [Rhizobium sp. CG5]|uniref:phage tail tube protein n=1 Tax=Rhizobium sp. CG5 TaxID=2726076 RepID=UPI002033CEE1
DQASDELLRAAFFSAAILSLQVVIPSFGTVTGPFQISALDYSGQHDGELQFEIALESAGSLTFGAV